jgi:hypothetical protein
MRRGSEGNVKNGLTIGEISSATQIKLDDVVRIVSSSEDS